jgi:hypothetical protein
MRNKLTISLLIRRILYCPVALPTSLFFRGGVRLCPKFGFGFPKSLRELVRSTYSCSDISRLESANGSRFSECLLFKHGFILPTMVSLCIPNLKLCMRCRSIRSGYLLCIRAFESMPHAPNHLPQIWARQSDWPHFQPCLQWSHLSPNHIPYVAQARPT